MTTKEIPKNKIKFKIVLDWNKNGMDLDNFLKQHCPNKKQKQTSFSKQMENSRVFYVLSPNQEDVFKVGIAGDSDGHPCGRFQQYRLYYGSVSKDNDCTGVKVHFVCKTKYNKMVEPKNSYIFKLEKKMKDKLKPHLKRGGEWMSASLQKIQDTFDIASGSVKEIETIPRRSERIGTKRLQGFDKEYEVEKLLDIVNIKGKKFVKVKWKGYIKTTLEPYKNIEEDLKPDLEILKYNLEKKKKDLLN